MTHINVAIAGFGLVGRTIAALLLERIPTYRDRFGVEVRLVAVCRSDRGTGDARGLSAERLKTLDRESYGPGFLASFSPHVLIEAGPSNFRDGEPGLSYLEPALRRGNDVIVVSKAALWLDGPRLRKLAAESGSRIKLNAAAGAALPALDLLEHSLRGCEVTKIEGIFTATTNHLLTAMASGTPYAEALESAQRAGIAERDPTNDVQGRDTAAKLLLIANFGLGLRLSPECISVSGLETVTPATMAHWREQGLIPRLTARLENDAGSWRASVGVEALPPDDPLSRVAGKDKAVRITSREMGEITAIGCGPEPMATAAAALKDLEALLAHRVA